MQPVARRTTCLALLLAVVLATMAFALRRLDANPITRLPSWPAATPWTPQPGAERLVVMDRRPHETSPAARSGMGDAGVAWLNFVSQEAGPVSVMEAQRFDLSTASRARLLIFANPTAQSDLAPYREAASKVLAHGGAVVLEQPSDAWYPLSGVRLGSKKFTAHRLTQSSFMTAQTLHVGFSNLELQAPFRPFQQVDSGAGVLLSVDGASAVVARQYGTGVVISTALELGRLWQQLQQGRPDPDGMLRNRYPEVHAVVIETNDLVADRALLQSSLPVVDLLESGLFRHLAAETGQVGWWPYPQLNAGALLITHDEEGQGNRASWQAQAEASAGCPSTTFLVPSPALTPGYEKDFPARDAALGLHLVLPNPAGGDYPGSGFDVDGRYRMHGFWKIHPLRTLLSPAEQARWLKARASNPPPIRASRTHFLTWSQDSVALFHGLVQAGIELDSSYGPDTSDRGYLFGTGRPFRPSTGTGAPLPILELPFVTAEDLGGATAAFLESLLRESRDESHQALTILYHPNAFAWHPSVSNYFNWKGVCDLAREMEHIPLNINQFLDFWHAREKASLQTTRASNEITILYAGAVDGMALILPARLRGMPLQTLTGCQVLARRSMVVGGQDAILIQPLPPSGTCKAGYRAPEGG